MSRYNQDCKIFPRTRLGIIKYESIALNKLTKEFGLRYHKNLYQEVDRKTAEDTMHDILCRDWDDRYQYYQECPRQQIQDIVIRFFNILGLWKKLASSTIRSVMGNQQL
jgi:hypothetical protein